MTESVNIPCWISDTTDAEELAADRLFVARRTTLVHATNDDAATCFSLFDPSTSLPLVAEWVKPLAAVHAGQGSLPVRVEA